MRKFFIPLLTLFLILSSCGGSKRIKGLTEFTPKLLPDSNKSVNLGGDLAIDVFGNENNFLQNMGHSLKLRPLAKNYKKIKISNNQIAALPSIANGTIYAFDETADLVSVDINSGKVNWKISLDSAKKRLTSSHVVYFYNKLYVVGDLQLFEIDALNGKEITRKSFPDLVRAQPLVRSNAIFVQNVSNNLTAYNTDTWSPAWNYETWPETLASHNVASPLIYGNLIISNYTTGQIVANNIADGAEVWQINLYKESTGELNASPQNATCQPVLLDKYLYVASNNGNLVKIDVTTSRIIWQKPYQDIVSMSVSGDTIFLTNNARQGAAIATEDGGVIWASDLINPKETKKDKIKPSIFLTPIISEGNVIILSKGGEAFMLDAINGKMIRYFDIPKNIISFGVDKESLILFDRYSGYVIN